MATMTKRTKRPPLPTAWRPRNGNVRATALRLIPDRPRIMLAVYWSRRVLAMTPAANPAHETLALAERYVMGTPYDPVAFRVNHHAWIRLLSGTKNRPDRAAILSAKNVADECYWANALGDHLGRGTGVSLTAERTADALGDKSAWHWLYATYSRALGPGTFDPDWRTDTAVALATGIMADRALDRMPILADALEDAGCDAHDHLGHMRSGSDELTLADWAIWNVLGWNN